MDRQFVITGERRPPRKGDWFISIGGFITRAEFDWAFQDRLIATPLADYARVKEDVSVTETEEQHAVAE